MQIRITENKQIARNPGSSSREWNKATRIHVFHEGETLIQNLIERARRPVSMYRSKVLEAHPDLEGHIRWSQTAGCSCGCSPGFIADRTVRQDGLPVDIYITLSADEPEEEVDMSYVLMALGEAA